MYPSFDLYSWNAILNAGTTMIMNLMNSYANSPTNPMNGMTESYQNNSLMDNYVNSFSSNVNINSDISSFSGQFESLSSSFGSMNSILSVFDIMSLIPQEAGILLEIAQLFSPSTIINLLYDAIDLFISHMIESSFQSSIANSFPDTSTFDTFQSKIVSIENFDSSPSINPMSRINSIKSDPNTPIIQGEVSVDSSSSNSSSILLNLYNSIFNSLRDISDFIENIMNPIVNIFYPLIDAISGTIYSVITKFLIQGDPLIAQKVTLIALLGLISSKLIEKGDDYGGTSGQKANEVLLHLPSINRDFKRGYAEIVLDVVALELTAIQLDASNDVQASLNSLGKQDLSTKVSYYSDYAWIIGFNIFGELAEDIGKMQSVKGSEVESNNYANALEFFSEFIRFVANVDYLFHYGADVFQNKLGFGLKLSDVAFIMGWMAFLGDTAINLILNMYGLYDNLINFKSQTYSGKDRPDWMSDPSDPSQFSPTMKKINNYLTIFTLLGGIVGYGLASINL